MQNLVKISEPQPSQADSSFSLAVCKECRGPNCCEIEPPFLTEKDVRNIVDATGLSVDEFSQTRLDNHNRLVREMKQTESHKCFFFDQESRQCRIYQNRPADCRLFPLDIVKLRNRYTWILYTSCPLEKPLARETAIEIASSAEATLLPELVQDLPAYTDCDTASFDEGHWIEVREVRDLEQKGACQGEFNAQGHL